MAQKRISKVNKRLALFLIDLAISKTAREAFLGDPRNAMAAAALNKASQNALLTTNAAQLAKLLDVSNQVQTAAIRPRGRKKRADTKKR